MQTEEKKKWHKEVEAKEKTVERKCFHSFNYVINHANIRFFFHVKFTLPLVILSVLLVGSFKLRLPRSTHKLIAIQVLL